MLLNNLYEAFNRFILDAREKPILTMLEVIRSKIMNRIMNKRNKMMKLKGEICPKIQKKLEKNKEQFARCWPSSLGGPKVGISYSDNLDDFVVDLREYTCTCRKWDLTRI